MEKTNKSLKKRLKVTRKGKTLVRKGGKIHFRAKQKRSTQLNKKKLRKFDISKKTLGHYLPYK